MTAGPDGVDSRIRVRTEGGLGRLTLDRPEALNALDLAMIRDLRDALCAWAGDDRIRVVLLDGAGERGLCAGGDVRGLHRQIVSGDAESVSAFFRAEYDLNAAIAESPAPVVAIADGVTMGGGIGLAGHAAVRVVTERSRLAMPETRIGFTPDVGGSWLLGRAPGRTGEYLALTGQTMDAADAIAAGFADHLVPTGELVALREALATDDAPPADVVAGFARPAGESELVARREWIDAAFEAATVPDIVGRLRARREPDARGCADLIETLSPTALTVNLAAVRSARGLPDLRAALAQEYGLVMWFATTQPDLVEGIRAQLVDKTRDPRWQPRSLAEVAPGLADAALAHRPAVALGG